MGRVTDRRSIVHFDLAADGPEAVRRRPDSLAAEEPLEIRVGPAGIGRPLGVVGSGRPASASAASPAGAADHGGSAATAANEGIPRQPVHDRIAANGNPATAASHSAAAVAAHSAATHSAAAAATPSGHAPLAVTMRTPGDDLDLAIGFLLTEGVIRRAEDVYTAQLCAGDNAPNTYNVVDVALAPGVPPPITDPSRNFYTTSSCGVCGKASIDAVRTRSQFDIATDATTVDAATLVTLPDALRQRQKVFATTGGLHAAGLFTADGTLVCLREDVGRHNAVDKVIGWAVRQQRLPLTGHILMVSGRASFELCQKAWMAGIPVLAAVSAPSTLAVDLADEAGLTVVGFLRGSTFNVYAGAHRVTAAGYAAGAPSPAPTAGSRLPAPLP